MQASGPKMWRPWGIVLFEAWGPLFVCVVLGLELHACQRSLLSLATSDISALELFLLKFGLH